MSGPLDRASLRVLIADDDADHRLLLRRLFKRAGIVEVAEAPEGETAIGMAADDPPDLIVLDLAMPNRSGLEVLPDLREAAPDAQIVIVSNFPGWRLAELVRRRGAVGYVEKGVRPEELVYEILVVAAMAERAARRVSSHFAEGATAPREARRFVRSVLVEADEELVETVELLVSEMVTNAVLHASSAPTVDVHLGPQSVRIEVYDDDPTLPQPRTPDAGTPGGRGLVLLDRMTARWGAETCDGGKVVWFELDR